MSYKYVPSGVFLVCDKGAGPGTLIATNHAGVTTNDEPLATDADLVPLVNISPCGVCSVLHAPCLPQPIQWQDVKVDTVVGLAEWHPLLDCSTIQCVTGGKIRILFTRAEADTAGLADTIHHAAETAKSASLWALAGGALCALAGVACCLTGVGAVAAPFLFAAAGILFETSAVTFEAGIALDVAALAVEPNLPNLGLVVVDALTLGAGKLIGKAVGAGVKRVLANREASLLLEQAEQKIMNALRPFKSEADPVADILGPGRLSHPEEWNATVQQLEKEGVEVVYRENTMAYGPATSPGKAGQLIIDENSSISALRHEAQHYADDKANGFIGMRQLYDPDLRWQMEYNAYMKEINMMREMRQYETAQKLIENARIEKLRIIRDIGSLSK